MAKGYSLIRRIAVGIAGAIFVCLLVLITIIYVKLHYLPENVRILTSRLPPLDRVEVELVHTRFETIDKVIATKTLLGPATDDLATIWREQNYIYGPEVQCHQPGYRIRFYQNNKLLTEATICFHCHNIYFYKYPNIMRHAGPIDVNFGAFMRETDDSGSAKLRTYLAGLFPSHDPDVESTGTSN